MNCQKAPAPKPTKGKNKENEENTRLLKSFNP